MTSKPLFPAANWLIVRRLFDEASELPAAEREVFLNAVKTGADASSLAEVRSLLAHTAGDEPNDQLGNEGGFLRAPAALTLTEGDIDRAGERLGSWEIVRSLGAGGMGDVFEVRRADGSFEGRAAAKLLKPGMDSASVLARFALERQALARLHHPHIAMLLDAGMSSKGLPFFVMEYVEGQPIDCASVRLSLDARLEIFMQLADAVAYAHRNLLVHRDLKPGNVWVTSDGQVKLLDFGIAKALDGYDLSADSTVDTPRPFTPNYASPEQVRGEAIGTATDIYSLGVLLYQLLTGVRPTGREAATPSAAAQSVLTETPTRPSQLSPDVTGDPDWLATRKHLAGDLDNIVMKALEKQLVRRYLNVEALIADLKAYRLGFPVTARPQSRAYVLSKFLGRHRLPMAAAGVAVVALIAGAGVATWQAHAASLARDDARQRLAELRSVTHELVFRFGDSIAYLSGGLAIKETLLQDTLTQLQKLVNKPDADPAALADISALHARLAELQGADTAPSIGRPEQARGHVDEAIAIGTRVWASQKADRSFSNWLARAYLIKAKLERAGGDPGMGLQTLVQARLLIEESLALQTRDDERIWLLQNLAESLYLQAQMSDAPNLPSLNQPVVALALMNQAEQAVRQQLAFGDTMLNQLDNAARPEEIKTKASLLHALANAQEGRALIHLKHDEPELSVVDAAAAVATQRQAIEIDPTQTPWQDGLMRNATRRRLFCCASEKPKPVRQWLRLNAVGTQPLRLPSTKARRAVGPKHFPLWHSNTDVRSRVLVGTPRRFPFSLWRWRLGQRS